MTSGGLGFGVGVGSGVSVAVAVASGAGMALLPESVAERYAAPGVRFLPLGGDAPTFATAVVTRRETVHMPTVAFLRAVPRARTVTASGSPVVAVA